MSLFRRTPPPVPADVPEGFWCAEARALQRSVAEARRTSRAPGETRAELLLQDGAEGRVVVLWHNVIVGFVPAEHAPELRGQLAAARPASLSAVGHLLEHEGLWRIWVGPRWPGERPPRVPPDELGPPPDTILGIPWRT
ncbi:hypothetical protein FHE66_10325 [Georgenia sp. 311]|uniref:hypothetical protein n=1 Tax=Georgenia sp. 311 TaxID=2585134 RepID=UPI001111E2D1|nr:hypothetical protein [Georgenia sp. 311]TNC17457.1 hypothetical protein FHE66_10325 [Georgenia sp. 311]